MRRILKYISISILCVSGLESHAQEVQESRQYKRGGLRIGVDGIKIIIGQVQEERSGLELVADYQVGKYLYVATEFGFEKVGVEKDNFQYYLNGNYAKLGVDYDVLKTTNSNDIVTFGLRYGLSLYDQEAKNIIIENYWGNYQGDIGSSDLTAHWLEGVVGVKTELFFIKNVFIGLSARANLFLGGKEDERMDAFIIPGYGKGGKNITFGYNWTLSYRIPFKREYKTKDNNDGQSAQ